MKKGRMCADARSRGDRLPLRCCEPGQKTDQGSVKAPPSVAVWRGTLLEPARKGESILASLPL
jgi:hypothetical protein